MYIFLEKDLKSTLPSSVALWVRNLANKEKMVRGLWERERKL